ncbi:hypothetical protein DRE_00330 [Drechslerella stenobrocha 248]|uniref:Transcription factor IIIC subunit 5 HTH domain-containing protein n=1 Tax=Drechslerella stenobrocha 248 TaxID=1043628 RepID=W7I4I3_9PEZI|nr:hypothetical protein DRE_00330 [Drechslerella stenobrocha 248]
MAQIRQNGGDASRVEGEFDKPRRPPAEAAWYNIPNQNLLSVEHPAVIVKNTELAMRMLGGTQGVAKAFQPNPENISEPNDLELRFRPGDALAPPIRGHPARTRAVVLKITVPKGKGPGAGSDGQQDIPKILKGLNGKYKAEAVGFVDHTIRFRDMADYQWNTRNSAWAKNVEENLMELDLQALKRFRMSEKLSADETTEIMRPPTFTHIKYPHVYGFRQNPAVKVDTDVNGQTILVNSGARVQTQAQYGNWNLDTVPQASDMLLPRGPRAVLECIQKLEDLFIQRPIWTRRGLMNSMPSKLWPHFKFAYPHIAYYWRSGPWRDTYVKFKVDPRTSKAFAMYQVAAFKINLAKSKKSERQSKSHIFDGERITLDGKIWQFCDIVDPLLASLVDITKVEAREICDPIDGWFPNNRHFKIKYVMRQRLSNILAGRRTDDRAFEALLREPDVVMSGAQPVRRQIGTEPDNVNGAGHGAGVTGVAENAGIDGDVVVDEGSSEIDEEEFETDSDEEDGERSGCEAEKGATSTVRDEKLQKLMERFLEGQQHEGITNGNSKTFLGGLGGSDGFDILGDD